MSTPYSAIIDASTSALLALSQHPSIVAFLAKSPSLQAEDAHGVNWPNHRKSFPLAKMDPRVYCEWTWVYKTRFFVPTPKELLTPELRRRSALAVAKCHALWEIAYELSVARYPVWRGVLMQETVYLTKKMQAQRFRDAGYPEDQRLYYPYVLQYADLFGLTLTAAADEILFKAQLDDDLLAKTESLRLKYFNLLSDVAGTATIGAVLEDFRRETYRKTAVK